MLKVCIYITFFLIIVTSCRNSERQHSGSSSEQQEALLKINKYLVRQDADAIKGYIKRHGWNMTETKSGLWYQIIEKGKEGTKALPGKTVTLSYKVWLLDGTLCYSSDKTGNKSFLVGKGGVEPGLEQGILMLGEGDKARFIMPPHLAFGLMGDEDKIPSRATIIYELQVLKISDEQ